MGFFLSPGTPQVDLGSLPPCRSTFQASPFPDALQIFLKFDLKQEEKEKKRNGNTAQKQQPLPTCPKDSVGVTPMKEAKVLSVQILNLTAENTPEDIKKH